MHSSKCSFYTVFQSPYGSAAPPYRSPRNAISTYLHAAQFLQCTPHSTLPAASSPQHSFPIQILSRATKLLTVLTLCTYGLCTESPKHHPPNTSSSHPPIVKAAVSEQTTMTYDIDIHCVPIEYSKRPSSQSPRPVVLCGTIKQPTVPPYARKYQVRSSPLSSTVPWVQSFSWPLPYFHCTYDAYILYVPNPLAPTTRPCKGLHILS